MLPLSGGLEVYVPSSPNARRGGLGLPLIGTRLLIRAGLRTDIDWARRRFSAWVPAPWFKSLLQFPRRLLGGRSAHAMQWHPAD